MAINEVFVNPTVKQVIFQITFPNLFYLESKIGDLQMRIMNDFPDSALVYRRQILFADVGPEIKATDLQADIDKDASRKMWQFKSKTNVQLSVQSDSLSIVSQHHKTYNLGQGERFRQVIESVVRNFLEIIPIQTISRIGLRYVDECPVPAKDNSTFKSYYSSVFPLERFDLSHANEMDFKTVVTRGQYYLRYVESLKRVGEKYVLVLDFDGYAVSIPSGDYLNVTDKLHEVISDEYEKTIKQPVYAYMRQQQES